MRVLIMGYMGGESGAYDAIGVEKCQPGYLCFEPTRCCLLIGESVRCIPGCFPGLKRTAGGGGSYLQKTSRSRPNRLP